MRPSKLCVKLGISPSYPFDERIHHTLLARLVELDRQLVAVDRGDVTVAEFLVEHAVAGRERRGGAGRFGDQLAFDGHRQLFWAALSALVRAQECVGSV